jgi:hypothetical protein
MCDLTVNEKSKLEKLFQMRGGYVLDFSPLPGEPDPLHTAPHPVHAGEPRMAWMNAEFNNRTFCEKLRVIGGSTSYFAGQADEACESGQWCGFRDCASLRAE